MQLLLFAFKSTVIQFPYPFPRFLKFRFASGGDRLLLLVGCIAAVLGGCSMPIMIVLFGDLTNAFVQNDIDDGRVCDVAPTCCDESGGYAISTLF